MEKLISSIGIVFFVAILIIAITMMVVGIWGTLLQWSVAWRYMKNNRRKIEGGKTARQIAEEMLAKLGYGDVRVRKTSILWLFFFCKWGNRYSPRRNTIFLFRNILNKSTVTAVAIATQKVGLVIQHRTGEKQMKFRAKWELWTRMAPNLFIPIVSFGIFLDVCFNYANLTPFGIVTMIFAGLAIVYTIIAFYCLYLIIPTERRAGELAFKAITQYNLIPAQYLQAVEDLYKVQVRVYIADFIMAILNLILDILYLIMKIAKNGKVFRGLLKR